MDFMTTMGAKAAAVVIRQADSNIDVPPLLKLGYN